MRIYQPERTDVPEDEHRALLEAARSNFVSKISDLPGFVSYYFMEAGEGKIASISIFESQTAADASNNLAQEWVKNEQVAEFLHMPPQIVAGEVLVHQSA